MLKHAFPAAAEGMPKDSILRNHVDQGKSSIVGISGMAVAGEPILGGSDPSGHVQPIPPAISLEKIMNHQLSRRSLVATAAVFATGAMMPDAIAENLADRHWEEIEHQAAEKHEDQDWDLRELEARFKAIHADLDLARVAYDQACVQARSMMPREPEYLSMSEELREAFNAMAVKYVADLSHPVAREQRRMIEENQRRRAAWQAECAAITDRCTAESSSVHERLFKAADESATAILAARARTMAGMLVKFRAHEDWCYEEADLLDSLEADIEAAAGVAA